MIQRIQSICLLQASGSFGGLFCLPFATGPANTSSFLQDGIYNILDNPFLIILTVLGLLLSFGSIFLYKNRPLQKRLSILSIIISVLIPALAAMLFFKEANNIGTDQLNDSFGLYMPIVSIILLVLAINFINKDEKIVDSMDRLR